MTDDRRDEIIETFLCETYEPEPDDVPTADEWMGVAKYLFEQNAEIYEQNGKLQNIYLECAVPLEEALQQQLKSVQRMRNLLQKKTAKLELPQ